MTHDDDDFGALLSNAQERNAELLNRLAHADDSTPPTGDLTPEQQEDMRPVILGKVYAHSDRHQTFYMKTVDGTRWIVQPEHWNALDAERWCNEQKPIVVTGMKAAGLPEVLRAVVTEVQFRQERK